MGYGNSSFSVSKAYFRDGIYQLDQTYVRIRHQKESFRMHCRTVSRVTHERKFILHIRTRKCSITFPSLASFQLLLIHVRGEAVQWLYCLGILLGGLGKARKFSQVASMSPVWCNPSFYIFNLNSVGGFKLVFLFKSFKVFGFSMRLGTNVKLLVRAGVRLSPSKFSTRSLKASRKPGKSHCAQ